MIYLDNAATTLPKPTQVIEAVTRAMQSFGNSGRGGHHASLDASRAIYETRQMLSELLGGEGPEQVAFTCNSTEALNVAIKGLLHPGEHVITTVLEHNSVLRPLYEMEERGVTLHVAGLSEEGGLDERQLFEMADERTRMIVCTHASNLTGQIIDIGRIGQFCRERGILFVVDASQTAGVVPIDMQKMKVDVLCFTGHKGLYGPQGTGGMCVRKGIDIRPLVTGGTGVQTFSRTQPTRMPTALEAGTLNGHGIAGLQAALQWIRQTGMEQIRAKEIELAQTFYEGISSVPGVQVYGWDGADSHVGIVPMNLEGYDAAVLADELSQTYGIMTRAGGHCAPLMHAHFGTENRGMVRFSFSWFNTIEEVRQAIDAIKDLA